MEAQLSQRLLQHCQSSARLVRPRAQPCRLPCSPKLALCNQSSCLCLPVLYRSLVAYSGPLASRTSKVQPIAVHPFLSSQRPMCLLQGHFQLKLHSLQSLQQQPLWELLKPRSSMTAVLQLGSCSCSRRPQL